MHRVAAAMLAAGFVCLVPLAPAAAVAQEVPREPAQPREAGPGAPAPAVEAPAMAEAPFLFRISATGGGLSWEDDAPAGASELGSGGLFGLEVESRVLPYLGFRLGGAYGSLDIGGGGGDAGQRIGAKQYVIDLAVVGRAAFEPLRRAGVVPFATIGLGTVVHDPEGEELITRSQGSWLFGGGVEVELGGRFAGRVEWRHYAVQIQNVFVPADRGSRERNADRWIAGLSISL